ncbi:MAG: hypothetical protein ACXWC1_30800 [Burkholderiales bacterium]
MQIQTMIVLGLALSTGGAFFSALATITNYKRQAEKSQQAAEVQKKLAEKSDEIARLNQEISTLTKESQAMITGGDAFCLIDPFFMHSNELYLAPTNPGKYPLYDLSIKVTDGVEFALFMREHHRHGADKPINGEELERRAVRKIPVGNLSPGIIRMGDPAFSYPTGSMVQERAFTIESVARNGAVTQVIRLRKLKDGGWAIAYRVYRLEGEGPPKIIKERIDDNFPKNEKGEVDWNVVSGGHSEH